LETIVNNQDELVAYLKTMIVEVLRLEDIKPEEIHNDSPLFGNGLGLDSIDALELVVAIEKIFNVIIADEDIGKRAFASVIALADFIQQNFGNR
jgi:acyl carrier protein